MISVGGNAVSPLYINHRIVVPATDLSMRAVRSGGPGGQNVNKVASKVELRFDLDGTGALDDETKARLRLIAGGRLDADGQVLVTSQSFRDQPRNLADARAKLTDLIARALERPKPRKKTKPSRASKERRLDAKHHRKVLKRDRRVIAY
jgi:ribosome-associated protein